MNGYFDKLNNDTINFCSDEIMKELESHLKFIDKITKPRKILNRSKYVSNHNELPSYI
jgi:hypothetical protein